jgi:hypothetical protein
VVGGWGQIDIHTGRQTGILRCQLVVGIQTDGQTMQHMRLSAREKCNTCEFLPRRSATGAHFPPGEIHTYRIPPREKPKNIRKILDRCIGV